MSRISIFNRSTSVLFGLGFIASLLGYIPNPILAAAGKLFSLLCYFLAYLSWYLVSKLYPNHPDLEKIAFNLNQVKTQNRISSFIGMVGVLIAAIAFVFPVLMIPASWIFVLSTCCWVYSLIHKQLHPLPQDTELSRERHKIYIAYGFTLLAFGLLTAISTTLMIAMPALTTVVITVSLVISLYLAAVAIFLLIEYFRPDPKEQEKASYQIMMDGELAPANDIDLEMKVQSPVQFVAVEETEQGSTLIDALQIVPPQEEQNTVQSPTLQF